MVAQDVQRDSGIELGVVHSPSLELSVLVVLDQVVIRVAREGERIEPQRIDRRELQEPKFGLCRGKMRQVEAEQIVAQKELGASGEIVHSRQRRRQVAATVEYQTLAGIRAHGGEGVNSTVLLADFEVQRQARGGEALAFVPRWGFASIVSVAGAWARVHQDAANSSIEIAIYIDNILLTE